MTEEREVRPGFLPPRAPDAPGRAETADGPRWTPPQAAGAQPPPPGATPAHARPTFVTASPQTGPSSAMAVSSMVLASVSIALLFVSVGVGYTLSGLLAAVALAMALSVRRRLALGASGRPGQARAAVVVASIALGLAVMAAVVWLTLESSGVTPDDLQRWLEDELERQRSRPGDTPGELA